MVLWWTLTSRGSSPICRNQAGPPSAVVIRNRLCSTSILLVCLVTPGESYPSMLNPPETFRTRLYLNCTCSTMHQVQAPFELRGVKTSAHPGCPSFQWFSKMLSSISTWLAFFSSNRFLTSHEVPWPVGTAPEVPAAPVSTYSVSVTRQ